MIMCFVPVVLPTVICTKIFTNHKLGVAKLIFFTHISSPNSLFIGLKIEPLVETPLERLAEKGNLATEYL